MHLRHARRKAKLTQQQLAHKARMTQAAISRLETGQVPPPRLDEAARIASVLARALRERGIEADGLEILYGKAS